MPLGDQLDEATTNIELKELTLSQIVLSKLFCLGSVLSKKSEKKVQKVAKATSGDPCFLQVCRHSKRDKKIHQK